MTRSRALPALAALTLAAAALTGAALGTAAPAHAQEASASRGSMTLTVSQASGLAPEGQRVTVRGSGYDTSKGIYVAFCVVPPAGQQPTPCGGGADTDGSSGGSVWISSFPPDYGTGLAQPYGDGGSFSVQIAVRAKLSEDVDCRRVTCAVVTRADHTRSSDRSLDVIVPVSFAAPPAAAAPAPAAPAPAPAKPAPAKPAPAQPAPAAPAPGRPAPAAGGAAAPSPAAAADPAAAPPAAPTASGQPPADPAAEPVAGAEPVGDDDVEQAAPTEGPDTELAAASPPGDDGPLLWPWLALGAAALAGAAVPVVRTLRARRASAA